jgi:acyl carrier protein
VGNEVRLDLRVIEQRVCDITSEQLGIPRQKVEPSSRLIEDLYCDSLDLVELIMDLEDEFRVTIPNDPANPVGKSVFTRRPFRLSDLAEIVYLHQGTGKPERKGWRRTTVSDSDFSSMPFSQLSGRWQQPSPNDKPSLLEPLGKENGLRQFRRRSDGMRCVLLSSAKAKIGNDGLGSHPDEQPVHTVALDSFLIDAEPISVTAYCRFLNSIEATDTNLFDWVRLDPSDDRNLQMPILFDDGQWFPVVGVETLPMVLVSWYGANAYSLWANGFDWTDYETSDGFLPSEAQWEYAALNACPNAADVEDELSENRSVVCGQHSSHRLQHLWRHWLAPSTQLGKTGSHQGPDGKTAGNGIGAP